MRCMIVDDEPLAHKVLEHYISETPGMQLVVKFRNAMDAFEYLGKHSVDLLFLDIEMPLVNGIHFLKALSNPPQTIFTTAYKAYAYDGFELDAVDYLLKPFSFDRFTKAVQKAKEGNGKNQDNNDTITIKDKQSLLVLKQQDIVYIEGCRDYVKIFTSDRSFIHHNTLKGILEKLNDKVFIQCHRSYIVNKGFVQRIQQDNIILSDQFFLPIGPLYKKAVLQKIGF